METKAASAACLVCGQAFKSIKWLRRHETVWNHQPKNLEPWPHGRCELDYCGNRGRWMVCGEIRCSSHRDQ